MPLNPLAIGGGAAAGEGLMAGLGQFFEPLNYPRKALWRGLGLAEDGNQVISDWTGADKDSLLAKALGFGLETVADPLNLVGAGVGALGGKGLAMLRGKVGSMVDDAAKMSPGGLKLGSPLQEAMAASSSELPMIENLRLPASAGRMSPSAVAESFDAAPSLKSVMERQMAPEGPGLNQLKYDPPIANQISDDLIQKSRPVMEQIPDDWFKSGGDLIDDNYVANSGGPRFEFLRESGAKPHPASPVDIILDASQEMPFSSGRGGRYLKSSGEFRGIQRPIEQELLRKAQSGGSLTDLEKDYIGGAMYERTDGAMRELARRWVDKTYPGYGGPEPGNVAISPHGYPGFMESHLAKSLSARSELIDDLRASFEDGVSLKDYLASRDARRTGQLAGTPWQIE